jgi:hypothetical protein
VREDAEHFADLTVFRLSEPVLHMKEYLALSPDSPDAQAAKDSMIVWKDKLSAFENAAPAARQ